MPQARLTGAQAILHAFANRNHSIYIAGDAIAFVGDWMQRIAVGWLAWEITGSGLWLGLVAFADPFSVDRRGAVWRRPRGSRELRAHHRDVAGVRARRRTPIITRKETQDR